MLRQYLKESTEFYSKEDNPLFYIFIIPKLVKSDAETVKGLNIKLLEKTYSPISFMSLFQTESVKKASIEYIEQYLKQFEMDLANEEKNFISAYNIHKVFETIKNSENYKKYCKNL